MYRLARCGDCSQRAHHNALRQRCLTDHFPCARRSRTSEAVSETDDAARRRPRGWSRCRLRRVPSIDTRSRCGGEEDRTPTGVVTQAVFKTVAVAIPRLAPPLGVLRSDRPEGRLLATSLDGDAHSYAASTVRLVHDQARAAAPEVGVRWRSISVSGAAPSWGIQASRCLPSTVVERYLSVSPSHEDYCGAGGI